jgi:NAD(P)H-dependent flavin oxidoreductase YrpB (nitropropane dioxygenase family)
MEIETALTKTLGVRWPLMQAGMNKAAGAILCAAVTNAGGKANLKKWSYRVRALLNDPVNGVFGVDLLLPKVGEGARKTNYDYTNGYKSFVCNFVLHVVLKHCLVADWMIWSM